jgi:hypothetical protein
MRYEEVLHRVKEGRNIVHTIKRRKANWMGHVWRSNCLLEYITVGMVEAEVTERQGRKRKQLLDDLTETRGCWKLKQGARHDTLWMGL